ncbi:hypothetical protein BN946_scf184791.g22 [Trametes cinnabarina]|uniref:Uncharacterized protein n=1 Tax=Pycnoporus cinnabarinus TaxID=5643 RepID=A0A060S4Q3_PYCCI|nr:hypothetical protein BN946_scf184791.g22 [Trametes cinnabarina]
MSDLGFNVWGSITGVIGLVTGLPALACWLYSQMPTYNMRILDQLLAETEVVFDSAIKGGLLHGGNGLHRFNLKIWEFAWTISEEKYTPFVPGGRNYAI